MLLELVTLPCSLRPGLFQFVQRIPPKTWGAMFSAPKSFTRSRSSRQTLPPVLTKAPSSAQAPRIVCVCVFFSLFLSLCSVSLFRLLNLFRFISLTVDCVCVSGLLLFTFACCLPQCVCVYDVFCLLVSFPISKFYFSVAFFVRSLSINLATVCMYLQGVSSDRWVFVNLCETFENVGVGEGRKRSW